MIYVGIKRSDVVINLLRFLALQIGSEVSYTDLGDAVGVDRKTVTTYIDLLEQCFVIFRLRAFSRSLRREVGKSQKFYEERDGVLTGYERKWNPARQMRSPREFLETYPGSVVHQIDRDNYWRYFL